MKTRPILKALPGPQKEAVQLAMEWVRVRVQRLAADEMTWRQDFQIRVADRKTEANSKRSYITPSVIDPDRKWFTGWFSSVQFDFFFRAALLTGSIR